MSPELVAAFASVITAMAVFVTAWRQGVKADERAVALAHKTDANAEDLKQEVAVRAGELEAKHDEQAAIHEAGIARVEVLVNGQMTKAVAEIKTLKAEIKDLKEARDARIDALEEKLGLKAGAAIPSSQILTAPDAPTEATAEVTTDVIEVQPKKDGPEFESGPS